MPTRNGRAGKGATKAGTRKKPAPAKHSGKPARARSKPAAAAAFFDLDRTLVADSTGLMLVGALVDLGLMSERDRVLADLTRRAYRVVGETWLGMQATRRSIRRVAGWSVEQLREAARRAVEEIEPAIYADARALIERHQAEGRLVCIATSTGRDIVEPVAELLGADHLIATEYEQVGGVFTGNMVGRWLWGPDKAAAVRHFAEKHRVDLEASYAYTDSYYDRHLLDIVGYPRPVNPDPLLRAYAARKGWPVLKWTHDGPRRPLELYDVLRPLLHPLATPFDLRVEGIERIPRSGPVIVAGNHRSYADPAVLAAVASRRGRKLRYLGKKEVFDAPVLGPFARAMGQIRVDRGTGSARPLRDAVDAIERGEAIGIFPQGTIPRGEAFFEPRLSGKTGVARLAVATGAPVTPVALWDTEKLWPRSSRVPNLLPPRRKVYARVGEPMWLKAEPGGEEDSGAMADLTQRVMDAIADLLPDEVRYPPPPSEDDIQKATPPNANQEGT